MAISKQKLPPKSADKFLQWFCRKELLEEIKGDLHETFALETKDMTPWKASLFYWIQILNFLRPFAITNQYSKKTIMLTSYFRFAKRNILKHKTSAFLNITSLSIGIACFTFIFVYLSSELKYDRFHENADHIYRIPIDFVDSKQNRLPDATTPPALAPALARDFPEVETSVRLFPGWGNQFWLGTEKGTQFIESKLIRTDSTFFDVFTFPLLFGDVDSALDGPNDIVITRKIALKYFGKVDVLGEKIYLKGPEKHTFSVSGVLQDLPIESHFEFDFLARITFDGLEQNWSWYNFYTYVKMSPHADMAKFEKKLQPFFEGYLDEGMNHYNVIYTQPLTSIHLHSHLRWELLPNGNIKSVYIFSALSIFVLIVSCLNYINLTMAQSVRRFKEVGVRKVFGANKRSLITQFIIETLLISSISLLLGYLMAEFALHNLNSLLERQVTLFDKDGSSLMLTIGIIVITMGLISGIFPAHNLSSFQVSLAIKGLKNSSGKSFNNVRSGLLLVQFTISGLMIFGSIVVYKQLKYMQNVDKGFQTEQVLILENGKQASNYYALKNELIQIPNVKSVSNADGILGKLNWTRSMGYPDPFVMNYLTAGTDFIETMEMETVYGRNFSKERVTDKNGWTVMVNETGMKELGLSIEDIGKRLPITQTQDSIIYGTVIGVLKDFQFTDHKMNIKPFALFYRDEALDYISIKISGHDLPNTLEAINASWNKVSKGVPVNYIFLDQVFDDLINEENRLSILMFYLTLLSFFIAFIGMFSVANMTLKNRVKEIAIRKTLGAPLRSIVQLVTTKFIMVVVLANVVSVPLAYFFSSRWLNNFSYRTDIGISTIAITLFATIFTALLILVARSLAVATANPIISLRHD